MPSLATELIAKAAEIDHALLSLIGAIVMSPMLTGDAIELIGALVVAKRDDDLGDLRTAVERVLRTQQGPTMENVSRHCHELRKKIREYQRLDVGGVT